MLVITRKAGEGLMIGDEIEVKVLSVDRDNVRVGITAPRQIAIHRQEVYELILRQNRLAAQSGIPPKGFLSRLKKTS
jgi:carbon storage regulator